MRNNYRLFRQSCQLDLEQLTRARESLELQSRVQQLVNTLRNVYGDIFHTATPTSLAPRSLFSTTGILEAVKHQSEPTTRIR